MTLFRGPVVLCALVGLLSNGLPLAYAQTAPAVSDIVRSVEKSPVSVEAEGKGSSSGISSNQTPTIQSYLAQHPLRMAAIAAELTFVIVLAYLAYRAGRQNPKCEPYIFNLRASFFFWLSMGYTGLLLSMAVAYNYYWRGDSEPVLLGNILPVAVPWFGALGAVTISLEGIFLHNQDWDRRYNYWHIGRPLFGAVLGIVAFFLFVLILSASGTTPGFLTNPADTRAKDFIIFYVMAFLVGYREQTFRELITRATDLILKPSPQSASQPEVTLKSNGTILSKISFPATALNTQSRFAVDVQNTGSAVLEAPRIIVTTTDPPAAQVFGIENDGVTGIQELAPSQVKKVDVTFTAALAGDYAGMLTVTAGNLPNPKMILISGKAQ